MKKKSLKLGLKKVNISNLSSVRGGNGSNAIGCVATLSRNFIDLCCNVFGTDQCTGGTDDPKSKQLNCGNTVAGECSTECYTSESPACG